MHGRPREYKQTLKEPAAATAYQKKVDTIKRATATVLELRKQRNFDPAALDAAAKLLKVVPEVGQSLPPHHIRGHSV